MASFWTSLPNAIESLQDAESVKENFDNIVDLKSIEHSQKQRCVCSQVNLEQTLKIMKKIKKIFHLFHSVKVI